MPALAAAALSASLGACGSKEAGSQSTEAPGAVPAASPTAAEIEAEAQEAADAIDESNADAELEKLKSELESE
jgi:hypothetical protein